MARKDDNAALAWTIGLGTVVLAGVGIYFYEKSQAAAPAAAAGGGTTVTLPGGGTVTETATEAAAIAAALNGTTVAAWQASGVPAATWAQLSPLAQQGLTAQGVHANAT